MQDLNNDLISICSLLCHEEFLILPSKVNVFLSLQLEYQKHNHLPLPKQTHIDLG